MKLFFCILALLCPHAYGLAQPIPPNHKGIVIGDTMPDVLLTNIYNHSLKQASFSALQKELTIIDFWASWCGACVGSFDKLQGLQKQFDSRLQLLMVNASPGEDASKLERFFKKRKERTGKTFTLPYSIQDTVLSALFPFKVIPHCIWLDRNRRVIAITDTEAITAANIEGVLNGKVKALPFKNDALLFDESRDVLQPGDTATGGLLHRSLLTVERPGMGVKLSYETVNDSLVKKLRILNYPLLQLYQVANPMAFANSGSRVRMDAGAAILFDSYKPEAEQKKYCYELDIKPVSRSEALACLSADLERYFNVRARAGEEWLSSYILRAGKHVSRLYTKGGEPGSDFDKSSVDLYINNGSVATLGSLLSVVLKRPVLDETGISRAIDIRMPVSFYNYSPEQVRAFLLEKGIELQEGERLWPVTHITTITNHNNYQNYLNNETSNYKKNDAAIYWHSYHAYCMGTGGLY